LVAEGLPRLLPWRGETIGQAAEIVAIGKVFWSGLFCGPNVAGLALELLSLRGPPSTGNSVRRAEDSSPQRQGCWLC
jgi:hypothetical protein